MIKEDLEQEKFNKELEDKLKIDFPNCENRCDEVYRKCVESNKKRSNVKLMSLICSFACLLIVCVVGSIFYLGDNITKSKDIILIENNINDLVNCVDKEDKMLHIMYIDYLINNLSTNELYEISNIDIFKKEKVETINNLIGIVPWGEYLSINEYYIETDLKNLCIIKETRLNLNYNSIIYCLDKEEFNNKIISLISVPYCEINYEDDIEEIRTLLYENSDNGIINLQNLLGEENYINFEIYSNGYVIVSRFFNNVVKYYVSLLKVDILQLEEICEIENKELVVINVLFNVDSIKNKDIESYLSYNPLEVTKEMACEIKFGTIKTGYEMHVYDYDKYKSRFINDLEFLYVLRREIINENIVLNNIKLEDVSLLIEKIEENYKENYIR